VSLVGCVVSSSIWLPLEEALPSFSNTAGAVKKKGWGVARKRKKKEEKEQQGQKQILSKGYTCTSMYIYAYILTHIHV
jgi:hypothetical protein